jgi:hypothetical protein
VRAPDSTRQVATVAEIETGLCEAADALNEIKSLLDDGDDLPRRTLYLAIEAVYARVNSACDWIDRLPAPPDRNAVGEPEHAA